MNAAALFDSEGKAQVRHQRMFQAVLLGPCLSAQAPLVFSLERQTAVQRHVFQNSPAYRVQFQGNRLDVEAQQAPWTEVLQAVSRETDTKLHSYRY
jgi:hypothetical protein